jgi:hypothetical protein
MPLEDVIVGLAPSLAEFFGAVALESEYHNMHFHIGAARNDHSATPGYCRPFSALLGVFNGL